MKFIISHCPWLFSFIVNSNQAVRYLFTLTCLFVIGILWFFLFYVKIEDKIRKSKIELNDLKGKIGLLESLDSSPSANLSGELNNLLGDGTLVEKDFLAFINSSKLELESFNTDEKSKEFYKRLKVFISLKANFCNLFQFLKDTSKLKQPAQCISLSLEKSSGDSLIALVAYKLYLKNED